MKPALGISKRVQAISWSGIREIFEAVQSQPDIIHLEVGQPDFDTPRIIISSAKAALDEGYTRYTSSYGIPELREAVAEKLRRDNGIRAEPSNEIVVTAGASAGVFIVCLALLDFGDEALIPDPAWPHYAACIRLAGGIAVPYPLHENEGFMPRIEDLNALVTEKTRLLILASPSNPTGAIITQRRLEELAQFATENNLLVLSDEVYEKLVFESPHVSFGSLEGMRDRTITVNSLSKTYAMTGWRVGYIAARSVLCDHFAKLNLYTNSCPNAAAQKAGVSALKEAEGDVIRMVAEFKRRRDFVVSELNRIAGVKCAVPGGAFYAFPNISAFGRKSKDVALNLVKNWRVATVHGSAFGDRGEGFLRVAYANSMENLKHGLERIESGLSSMRER